MILHHLALCEPIQLHTAHPAGVISARVSFAEMAVSSVIISYSDALALDRGFGQLKAELAAAISHFVSEKDVFSAPACYICICAWLKLSL